MNEWLSPILTIIGAALGAYVAVKVTVAVLQTQMSSVIEEIKELRRSKHDHAGFINEHEMRITELERWRNKSGG